MTKPMAELMAKTDGRADGRTDEGQLKTNRTHLAPLNFWPEMDGVGIPDVHPKCNAMQSCAADVQCCAANIQGSMFNIRCPMLDVVRPM